MAHKPRTRGPELVWAGKYDEKGELKPVDRTILPFQVVETVNESKADREKAQRDLFTKQAQDSEWRNMLIWGDNKVVMSSLLPRFAGKINLIYIDPPFATGQDFSYRVRVGDEEFVKEPSIIEEKAYRDTWGRGLDSYLQMMYERLVLMRQLLADDGSIYVHMDYRVGHPVKLILDELFGAANFRNEITWRRQIPRGMKVYAKYLAYSADYILIYTKTDSAKWNPVEKQTLITVEQADRKYMRDEVGYFRTSDPGTYSDESLIRLAGEGRIYVSRGGRLVIKDGKISTTKGKIGVKYYREIRGDFVVEKTVADNIWDDIPGMGVVSSEYLGFATQKPGALLDRIIRASSDGGDLVADLFCGSGTTGAVAEKLGRRWIICDLSKWAIQVTRKRLLQIEGCKPFEILNLGNYERHKLAANGLAGWDRYVKFILQLYRAEPVSGFKMLHGKKARASVHVGSVDSPITMREIRETLKEAKEAGIREVHFLGWDFEMGLHDLVSEVGDEYGVKIRLVSIPKESLEVTDRAREKVRFFDLNYLELAHGLRGKTLTVTIKDFIIANPEYLPDDVREKIKKFSDYIDYWAVDWDYHDDTFHNGWQSFRTRKNPKLETKATWEYDNPGAHKVLVKVVDIFGNDTTKMLEVRVR